MSNSLQVAIIATVDVEINTYKYITIQNHNVMNK